jgi:DNA-binding beta-propeller fold protein YncE
MMRWKYFSLLSLALGLAAVGCGSNNAATTVTVAVSPSTASVITNTAQTFTAFVNGTTDQVVTWTVTCPTGVTAPACGAVDTNGVYTAPKTIPTVTTNGTTTITPTATITATAHADTTKTATATVTIISGISISIAPSSATVGTGEHFTFTATVNNPGCDNSISTNQCLVVTWSLPSTLTGAGTIDPNTGVYSAPSAAITSVTVTATSVKDTAVTATALVTVVTATPPTLTSVSPKTVGLGSLFQDIYITGTNFISTNNVFVNGNQLGGLGPDNLPLISIASSSVIRARIPDSLLATIPAQGVLKVTVSPQTGAPQTCSPDSTQCQIVVSAVRPAITGPSPDNILQGTTGALSFNVDGGFFGTNGIPAVSATFGGQLRTASVANARQMSVIIGGSNAGDFSTPGLYPVAIHSAADSTKLAVTNIAVQPNYGGGSSITNNATVTLPTGSSPSDVAINPATGLAIVANTGTDSVSFIALNDTSSSTLVSIPVTGGGSTTRICTAFITVNPSAACTPSAPKSVAVDYVRNKALVVNTASQTIAVVDLGTPSSAPSVTSVTPLFSNPPFDAAQHPPVAVGVNPVTGRALVTLQNRAYGVLLDVTQTPPVVLGPVTISTGANSRVAVEPHLNWAIATPGGLGSTGIVDLNRQNVNTITNIARALNVVTVTVQASTTANPQSPLAVQLGDTVFIQGVLDSKGAPDTSFDGFYTVTGLGPAGGQFSYTQNTGTLPDVASYATPGAVNYAAPVATLALTTTVQGIGINTETQQAVLVDPSPNGASRGIVSIFSLLDQSVSSFTLQTINGTVAGPVETGSVAGAFNSLTDVAVTVNPTTNTLSVIDPSTPKRLTDTTSVASVVLSGPVAVAVDPATNLAVVANQKNDTVSVISLGTIQPLSITETSPKEFVANSTLGSVASPGVTTLTIIGKGFTTSSTVRLDGIPVQPQSATDREITVVLPPSLLTSARRFAVDVLESGAVSNASDFTVTQSIDVSTGCSTPPLPEGVAVDPVQNIAAVTLSGCNTVALIDLSTGTGGTVAVGTNPLGVAVLPLLHKAVVANSQSSNASVVDELQQSATNINTGANPVGVAADQDTGEAAVTNSVANTVSIVNLASEGVSSISTGQHPIAVAFDYLTHQIAVAADASNSVGIATAPSGSLSASFGLSVPTSVAFDPSTNSFLAASGANNSITIYDPTTQQQTAFLRVGINPTAIAYNYLTGTLISTNTGSHTITVADILSKRIRAVLTASTAAEFSSWSCGTVSIRRGYSSAHECRSDCRHSERTGASRACAALIFSGDTCSRNPGERARSQPTRGSASASVPGKRMPGLQPSRGQPALVIDAHEIRPL